MTDYITNNETPEQTRTRLTAEAWRHDAEMEHVATLKLHRPEVYDRLSPATHMSLGFYQNGKAAAQAQGIDTTGRRGLGLDTAKGDR